MRPMFTGRHAAAGGFQNRSANKFPRRKASKMTFNKMRVFGAGIAILAMSFTASAQAPATTTQAPATAPAVSSPAATLPSADQILDKYIAAIGGEAAWHKLNSRVSKGTIEIPAMSLSGTVEVHDKAPGSSLAVVSLGGATFQRGCDGTTAWADDPQNGLRTLSGAEADDSKRQADFYHQINMRKYYSNWKVTGTEKIGDHDAYVVEATSLAGDVDKMYFDTQSGLMLRAIITVHTGQGATVIQSELSDYRDTDGIKLPFSVHQSSAQTEYTITFSEVHHNVDLSDGQFAKPAAQ
jgi:outer membrane lipoprotein-sorting protein